MFDDVCCSDIVCIGLDYMLLVYKGGMKFCILENIVIVLVEDFVV